MEIEAYGEHKLKEVEIGKKLIDGLAHYYPNHAFFVEANIQAGTVTIQLLYQDKNKVIKKWNYGMLIHMINLDGHDSIMKYAKNFGGELLERYRIARSGATVESIMQAMENGMDISGAIA